MRKFICVNVAMTLTFVFLSGLVSPAWGGKKYRIGAIFPVGGALSSISSRQRDTLTMLAERTNAKRGVNSRKLELVILDSKANPSMARAAATKLIEEHDVVAIIGPCLASTTLATEPVVTERKVPLISMSSHIKITQPVKPWVFQTAPRETLWIDKALEDIKQKGFSRISLAGPENLEMFPVYTNNVAKALHLKVVGNLRYQPRLALPEIINKFWEFKPDVEAFVSYDPSIRVDRTWREFLRRRKGLLYLLFPGVEIFNRSPSFPKYQNIRLVLPAFLFSRFAMEEEQKDKLKDFLEIKRKYGDTLRKIDFPVYDAFMLVISALRKSNETKTKKVRKDIRNFVESQGKFVGLTGVFSFSPEDHNGLSVKVLRVVKVNMDNGCPDDLHHCPNCECADSAEDCR